MAVAGGRNIGNPYFTRTAGENFIDLDTFVAGALLRRLGTLFDQYWNSDYGLPVQAVARTALSPVELRARFEVLTSRATTPPPPRPAPNDVLGYSPIAEEIDAGRLDVPVARIWLTLAARARINN